MNGCSLSDLCKGETEAGAMLRNLARHGAIEQAHCAVMLGDMIAKAPDLIMFANRTNLRSLLFGFADIASHIAEFLDGDADASEVYEALERLRIYSEVCPPLTRRFLERVASGDPAAIEKLSEWLFDE